MIDSKIRKLLSEVDSEFEKARFSLFKASIYLEKIDAQAFKTTLAEITKTIKDLGIASESLVDFINKQDFKETDKSLIP